MNIAQKILDSICFGIFIVEASQRDPRLFPSIDIAQPARAFWQSEDEGTSNDREGQRACQDQTPGNGVWLSEGHAVRKEQSDSVAETREESKRSDVGSSTLGRGEFGLPDGGCGNDAAGAKTQERAADYKLSETES